MIFVFASSAIISAQSPTTDILDKGQVYIEANFWTATQNHRNGGEQVYGGRFGYGIGKGVEVSINGSFSDPNDTDFPPEIQPSVKWKFYENKKRRIAAAAGVIGFVPIAKRTGTNTFGMIYGNVSKVVNSRKEVRITVGSYLLFACRRFDSRAGWNFNYEQSIARKVTFSIQWVTGNNRFGYITPGLNIGLTKKSNLFIGYSIGNYRYDNHGPYLASGFYF